jgi:5-methylthioribose kinase
MSQRNWLLIYINKMVRSDETIVSISKPGDGNMNCVLRIETATRLYHQAPRGYVEKYPQVLAPADRVLTEGAFIKKIAIVQEQEIMPKL